MPPVSTHDSRRAAHVTLKAVTLLSGVLTIVFLVSFFFSDRGIAELQEARRTVSELKTDIDKLQAENERLRAEIESAKSSTFAVEKIAREDLAMSKEGEIVYMLPAAEPAVSR
ncbi:MAG TPA: septum formation initiator family protein [Thermoanaerobaculia bacterium]|nr:septum formation initiator family protein [Thermoanaerobaculia bacterium]